jgi:DtxR family Mn-dependent transcriptional regulator
MRKSTVEQYLKTIDFLEGEHDRVKNNLMAERLGVKPSSVSEFCRKLKTQGYIDWKPYKGVKLTDRGKLIASKVENRYRTLMAFFQLVGLDSDKAVEEACLLEHEISDESSDRLRKLMGKVD